MKSNKEKRVFIGKANLGPHYQLCLKLKALAAARASVDPGFEPGQSVWRAGASVYANLHKHSIQRFTVFNHRYGGRSLKKPHIIIFFIKFVEPLLKPKLYQL